MLYQSTFSQNFLQHTHDVSMIMMNFNLPLQVVSSANRWKHKQAILLTIYTAASQNTCSRTCLFLASNKGASYRIFIAEIGNCIFLHALSLTAIGKSSGNYRPPTILREGNVFSRVCHSVGGGGCHTGTPPFNLDLTVPLYRAVTGNGLAGDMSVNCTPLPL